VKKQSRRSFVVLSSLVGVLTLTSVLLRAMQGAPLTPDASSSLIASQSSAALQVIYNTQVPPRPHRWNSIYVHHSGAAQPAAAAATADDAPAGDHFVITAGKSGEICFSQRWNMQEPADPWPGRATIEPTCISICVVGDFDRAAPSPTQLKRLEHLVQTLQERFRIPAAQVWLPDYPNSDAGVGRYFPAGAFQGQLLR
jgi:N-acetyl-anhydromuramyl-L-alanine amidase AmpD